MIAIDRDSVTGEWFVIQRHTVDGEIQATLRADYLVLATDGPTTARLLGSHIKTSLPTLKPGPEVALVTLVVEQPALTRTRAAPACWSLRRSQMCALRHLPM